jgi:Glycosyl transferase family 11
VSPQKNYPGVSTAQGSDFYWSGYMRIVVRQLAGLGNQIFQYAAGMYYARKYNADLRIVTDRDKEALDGSPRPYQLSRFSIKAPDRQVNDVEKLVETFNPKLKSVAAVVRQILRINVIEEPTRHHFYPDLPGKVTGDTIYIRGFWQAAQYAALVEKQLCSELVLRDSAAGLNLKVLERILKRPHSVFLHVRRGDYLLNTNDQRPLQLSYYSAAIRKIREAIAEPTFFVFSDDIEFARENLGRDIAAEFVDHNDEWTAYEDLRLMSACKHSIIANSSFSWWGAWLNANPTKIVLAPKYWHCTRDTYYPDLFPSSWTLVDNL